LISNEEIIASWAAADPTPFDEDGDLPRRHLLNPALFSLLGDVAGKHVLDAGSGQGYLSRMLARLGALVTAVEPSDTFYRYALARERLEHLGITYLQADLSRLNDVSADFDTVVANMVLIDIPNFEPAMANCVRALKAGGVFLFTLSHPCFEESGRLWNGKRRVEIREYLEEYVEPQRYGALFHRPLSRYLNLVIDLGCRITRVLEPQLPANAVAEMGSDRDVHVPSFVVIATVKEQPAPPAADYHLSSFV
jgi:SAM-dependent methyltransferase